jgi:hypothetical protein
VSIQAYRDLLSKADDDDIKHGRGWYKASHNKVHALASSSGYTPEQVAGVVAVLSPMVEWNLNWKSAERLCVSKGKAKGMPGFSDNKRKAKDILKSPNNVEDYVRGPKVHPFFKSLLNPEYPLPVIDTQMIAAFYKGIAYRDDLKVVSQSEKRKAPIYAAIKTLAGERGWPVAEMQAVLWITFKRVNGKYADQLKLFK